MRTSSHQRKSPPPPFRRLRHFAFDPSLSRRIETYDINEVTANLPWDKNLRIGPIDDYLEVVDYDPASQLFYAPVDLNERYLLARDGLDPSDSNPQFHQQMVYAVARTTIGHFEKAIGRKALWAPRTYYDTNGKRQTEYVPRLRIYPHAMRDANAYYTPDKKALLFGYFPATANDPVDNYPGETVFACLSHDVIAHETTHALLDGLHQRFIEPSNVDVQAFHEAFADIVALFQHFTYPEVLRHEIARTRGDLKLENRLGEMAYQFGQAIGNYGALRNAIGTKDEKTGEWAPQKPDPRKILKTTEPHERGSILVAAVFDAFITVFHWRVAGLLRVATGGSGELPPGELHPDLVDLLAKEAAKTAGHVLQICIRALDYCPPVDINFGDYLRALITADADMVSDDRHNYRLAFIQAFRQRGIIPGDVRNMSEASLLWEPPDDNDARAFNNNITDDFLKTLALDWKLASQNRKAIYRKNLANQATFHRIMAAQTAVATAMKVVVDPKAPKTYRRSEKRPDGPPVFQVYSIRPTRRVGPDGNTVTDLVVEVIQTRYGYFKVSDQKDADNGGISTKAPDFLLRGGCTLLINPQDAVARYCIYKRIDSDNRLQRTRDYLTGEGDTSPRATYFGDPRQEYYRIHLQQERDRQHYSFEPFALLHRSRASKEVA